MLLASLYRIGNSRATTTRKKTMKSLNTLLFPCILYSTSLNQLLHFLNNRSFPLIQPLFTTEIIRKSTVFFEKYK